MTSSRRARRTSRRACPANSNPWARPAMPSRRRSEEHTSELQSPCNLVCRLLLEKKNLSTVAPMRLLERSHSYKDKLARGLPPSVGLFNYPVLMAADILIYDSDVVPVGKDQRQHIEITRDLAVKMNETFGSEPDGRIFKLPEARIQAATEVVPGIDGQKMSKSYGNNIDIFSDEKETWKRVMSIVTDSTPVEAPKEPSRSTIFQL